MATGRMHSTLESTIFIGQAGGVGKSVKATGEGWEARGCRAEEGPWGGWPGDRVLSGWSGGPAPGRR